MILHLTDKEAAAVVQALKVAARHQRHLGLFGMEGSIRGVERQTIILDLIRQMTGETEAEIFNTEEQDT